MSQIVPMICNRMKNHLEYYLQTQLSLTDPLRANTVKVGRYLQNPVTDVIHVSIHPGDPEDPNLMDGLANIESLPTIGIDLPWQLELGGGSLWWRNFTCMLGVYYVQNKLPEMDAMENAYKVYGRMTDLIPQVDLTDLVDDNGESAIWMVLTGTTFFEGGGNNQFLWRGKARWRVLTGRP